MAFFFLPYDGINAGSWDFLLFPHRFLPHQRQMSAFDEHLLSQNTYDLVVSKILLLRKDLTFCQSMRCISVSKSP